MIENWRTDQENRLLNLGPFDVPEDFQAHNRQHVPVSQDDLRELEASLRREFNGSADHREPPATQAGHQRRQPPPLPSRPFDHLGPGPSLRVPKKKTGLPKRRDPLILELARITRQHLEELVPKNDQIIPTVSVDERRGYEAIALLPSTDNRLSEATSEDNFRFDVLGTRNSAWNKSAARVFADLTMRHLGLKQTYELFEALRHAFIGHLERIIRRYKRSQQSIAAQLELKSGDRQQTRKYQLFQQRHYIAHDFPPFNRHIPMLEYLGIEGMSSDESDQDANIPRHPLSASLVQYRIRTPQWRDRSVTTWLRMFDSVHNILRWRVRPGADRRSRNDGRKSENPKFVPGLPINAYDPRWMESDTRRKYDSHPRPEPYDFAHDADVIEWVP
ncbi:hypothetical protein K438DRAFT_1977322 [Mycena galopus ATCC 62051]|nr:hypothetical protein K438DRAFT_1977322 [Mycena galopus ATCC 62051]